MDVTGTWSAAEAVAYLERAVVPVRLACHTPAGHLWMLSLWFGHRDGSLWCATGADADVVDYLDADGEVAFEVSTNDPPYRGVRGNGEATVHRGDAAGKALLEELLERYLGDADGPLATRLLADDREEVRIEVEPRKLYSWDFSDRMS
jgi:nitroimidazol reductase NimA-like FMN-containing flavoprotein (pyridoxamine 5'-phosphate oxidase superfamily)